MNAERLRQTLLAVARQDPPSEAVPFAFERRIMNRLTRAREASADPWTAWGSLLWRAVLPCCAVMLVVGAGSFAMEGPPEDLGEQLDAVLLADLDAGAELP